MRNKEIDTLDVAGGLGSPRHYGGVSKEQPLLSPSHPHSGCPATPAHNQHNVTNTQQHFSNQQHSSMIYHTTANTINTADMQNNQFCYDRTSVPLYSSGPGDTQDARPLPPGNPVNHQLGGKSCDHLMSCDHHFVIITLPTSNPLRPLSYLKTSYHQTTQRHETFFGTWKHIILSPTPIVV